MMTASEESFEIMKAEDSASSDVSTDNDSDEQEEVFPHHRRLTIFQSLSESGCATKDVDSSSEHQTEASQSLLKLINMEDNATDDFEENWSQSSVEHLLLE
jgi:hypothetical protein